MMLESRASEQETQVSVSTTFGQRVRGARLYRGYVSVAQAAVGNGMDQSFYADIERTSQIDDRKIIKILADRFGVTATFLREGKSSTVVDRNAEAHVGLRDPIPTSWGLGNRRRIAAQLKTLRLARGFRKTSDAALYFGWPLDLYSEIEGGRRNFSVEMVVMYAADYAAPAAYLYENGIFFTAADWRLAQKSNEILSA